LSKEKTLVGKMKNEISHFESIFEEKERYIESLRCENNKLIDHYRKVADEKKNIQRRKIVFRKTDKGKKRRSLIC
jgi:predicted RNase H-like nuclease (RuvC/YqgF family)